MLCRLSSRFMLLQRNYQQLALTFRNDQLEPHESKIDLISTLVPNFFAQNALLQIKELKQQFKTTHSDKNFNSVSNSFLQLNIPLGSNEKLRDQFTKLETNWIRIGRLLEVLDGLVGLVAYRYCHADITSTNRRAITVVTLSVYNLSIPQQEIENNKDLLINSYVTYVGRSSIEIQSDLYQEGEMVANVQFLMVARDVDDYKKSVQVPQLNIEDEQPDVRKISQVRYEIGKQNQLERKEQNQLSLTKLPPDPIESKILHQLFLTPNQGISINHTKLEKNALMHKQERNVHGKVFGGHIMQEIVELGWLCGFKHNHGVTLHIIHIFDVMFVAPVPIGSCVSFTSRVVYTQANIMIVQVKLHTLSFDDQREILATEVHLALQGDNSVVQEVNADTYEEGMAYLLGKRLFSRL